MLLLDRMAYEIHIKRIGPDGHFVPVTLSGWRAAVEQTPNVRLARGDDEIANSKTGEVIRITNAGGDVEVLLSGGGQWQRVFRWSQRGSISFKAPDDFSQPDCEIRRVAARLARVLGARLIGDEGETYD
jgi:hypothetical protein